MKKIFFVLLLAAMALTTVVNAQEINGDLNHNDALDVEDVTLLIDGYLTGDAEYIIPKIDFYQEDNSLIYGKWWNTRGEFIWYKDDGTVNGLSFQTYKFFPSQGRILMYDNGTLFTSVDVVYLTDEVMIRRYSDGTHETFTRTRPEVKVTNITLYTYDDWGLADELTLSIQNSNGQKESKRLYAYIEPDAADNKNVVWSSSNEDVATVVNGTVQAVGEGYAYIVCALADGSNVSDTCMVNVQRVKAYNNGHEYVDLGLSVKWSTMDVGANSPEERSTTRFAWGETTPKDGKTASWSNYKWCAGTMYSLTKYNTRSEYGTVDNKTVLEPADDAANVMWGGTWRTPSVNEYKELANNCTWTWTTQNGATGWKVTGPNGNSIFMYCSTASNSSEEYWLNEISSNSPHKAYTILYTYVEIFWSPVTEERGYTRRIRAVCE